MNDDRTADPWGARTPYGAVTPWPARVDEQLADGVSAQDVHGWVQSASLLHSNGDAMDIAVRDGAIVGVRGREVDRVNRGRLGPKDLFAWQANASPDRLTTPLVRVDGELVPTDWDTAMQAIADRSSSLLAEKRPGALGFYSSFSRSTTRWRRSPRPGSGRRTRRQHAAVYGDRRTPAAASGTGSLSPSTFRLARGPKTGSQTCCDLLRREPFGDEVGHTLLTWGQRDADGAAPSDTRALVLQPREPRAGAEALEDRRRRVERIARGPLVLRAAGA